MGFLDALVSGCGYVMFSSLVNLCDIVQGISNLTGNDHIVNYIKSIPLIFETLLIYGIF
jgi:hypothetical protein